MLPFLDKYYRSVVENYGKDKLDEAYYWETERPEYNINLLTTPVYKIIQNIEKQKVDLESDKVVVLLSTGGFYPIHEGHLFMMESARKRLETEGYKVVGGYISCSHDDYVTTKPYINVDDYDRVDLCRKSLEESDWLTLDPWESLYTKSNVNFTEVIERLESYIQKHIHKNIEVAYVFGSDNSGFSLCFSSYGIGVCIQRAGSDDKYEYYKSIAKGKAHFIDNKEDKFGASSRIIRKNKSDKEEDKLDITGKYLLRDEGLYPLSIFSKVDEEVLKKVYDIFKNKLVGKFKEIIDFTEVDIVNSEYQTSCALELLEGKKIISLDSGFIGDYNLETTRLFYISDYQLKNNGLINRPTTLSIEKQIEKIPCGNYILLDDDSMYGMTIRTVKSLLPEDIVIDRIFLMSSLNTENVYDIVDIRDFIIGSRCSGLTVELPNKEVARVPYILPFVSLKIRASIPPSKELELSRFVIKLNKEFYSSLDTVVLMKDLDIGTQIFLKYCGFSEEDNMIDICKWFIERI